MGQALTGGSDGSELPLTEIRISGLGLAEAIVGGSAALEYVQRPGTVAGVGAGLGGDRADGRHRDRDPRTDRRELAGHGDTEVTGGRVTCNQRESGYERCVHRA